MNEQGVYQIDCYKRSLRYPSPTPRVLSFSSGYMAVLQDINAVTS